MCEGHHGWESASQCCWGGAHRQQHCGCGRSSGCDCEGHHGWGGGASCCCGGGHWQHGSCCGGHPSGFHRRFSTREEEAAALEDYLKELEAEAKGVRERLAEMRPQSGACR